MTLASLCLVTMIVLTTQALLYINILTQSGQSLLTFLKLALTLVPGMILIVLPFALLLGASATLNRMNSDSELAVLEAAGAGKAVLLRPILVIAAGATIASLILALAVEPWANGIRRDLRVAASADLIGMAIQSGSFRQVDENLYIQIAEQHGGGTLGGIFIADRRDPALELIYYARTGRVSKVDGRDVIIMNGGEIHRRTMETGDVSIISFVSYAVDMSLFGAQTGVARYTPNEWPTAELFRPDPGNEYARERPDDIRAEMHDRLSVWLYPPAFALIAVVFAGSARANREERAWNLLAVCGSAFLLRGAGFLAGANAGGSAVAALACYALPLGACALLAWLLIRGRTLAAPRTLIEKSGAVLDWLAGQRRHLAGLIGRPERPT